MHAIARLKHLWAAAAILALACTVPAAADAPLRLTLVHVNDWDRMEGVDDAGGAARIAAVVARQRDRARADGGHVIVTFGGDMISPSLLSGIDKGAHMIDLANRIGFDVAVLGNHEFDFGPEALKRRLAESGAVWLAGNVSVKGSPGFPGAAATAMVERGGYRVGFLGLVTPETAVISKPGPDVSFAPVAETGARLAGALRSDGADIVVALTHQGLEADLDLLRRVKDIDIVLGGHDHLLVARYDGRQAVMQSGSQGRHVGVLDLTLDRAVGRRGVPEVTWTPGFGLHSTAGIAGDAALAAKVSAYLADLDATLNVVIGETGTELDTRSFMSRSGETAFGNLLADAMRAATGSDIGLTNSGGIRGDTVYSAGTRITRKIVLAELPFGNRTVVLRLTGAQVRRALENGVSRAGHPSGRFPQVSGLAFSFDPRRSVGARVTGVTIGGAPLDDGRTYTVATNDFLARGGDGYTVFRSAEMLIDPTSGALMANHLIAHIAAAGTVSPVKEGRIRRED